MIVPEGLKAKEVSAIHVDWFDLDDYLKEKYDCPGTHIPMETSNDSDFYVTATSNPAFADWANEALDQYKKDEIAHWNLHSLMDAACRDGHIPEGNYVIRVSW